MIDIWKKMIIIESDSIKKQNNTIEESDMCK